MYIKKAIFFVAAIITCLLYGCSDNNTEKAAQIPEVMGKFEFSILKSGQADAIFLQTQNNDIIIDCGEEDDGDELVGLLNEKGVSNVDYLFITHYDKDHVGGFPEVIENIPVSNIIVSEYEGNNEEYDAYLKVVEEKKLDITALDKDITLVIDDVLFEVSIPKKQMYKEEDNDFSLVISATHGENTFLFAGDAEKDRLAEVLSEFGKQYDFLKVPHHGKYNKNTKRFITTVKPAYSVICDSEKHPAEDETISILEYVKSEIYSTKDGNVYVSSDGKEIKISQ